MFTQSKYSSTEFGHIGISVSSDSLEETKEVQGDVYATFEVKRLTKASSFIIIDEVFYIAKKKPDGKASSIYFVYRVSDMRLVVASPHSKEKTIELVREKYYERD